MSVLEQYEWCDFWWQEAPRNDKKRVLLVGDSISRAYRPYVNEQLKGEIYADQLSSSRALDNPIFIIELEHMLKLNNVKYDAIHFNNGLHGFHLTVEQYELHLEKTIQHILGYLDSSKVIMALSTPVTKQNLPTELEDEMNNKVLNRNEVMKRLALKYNIKLNDLYTEMLGKSEYRVNDGYHYNAMGEQAQAVIVAKIIQTII
jgi:lysophospholipase L1-like esterase